VGGGCRAWADGRGFRTNAVRLRVQAFEILEQRMSLDVSRDRGLVPSLTG